MPKQFGFNDKYYEFLNKIDPLEIKKYLLNKSKKNDI